MSIAEAIENAQTRVSAVYDKCEERGAKLPETKNLANLPSTIDTIPAGGGGDVVKAYVSGVNLWKPSTGVHGWQTTSVHDVDVLLTKVGYQATGSDTFSPEVRVSFITENGFAGNVTGTSSAIFLNSAQPQKYDIINGSVDSAGSVVVTESFSANYRVLPFFFHNGQVFAEMGSIAAEGYMVQNGNPPVILYTPNKFIRVFSNYVYGLGGLCFLETGIYECQESRLDTLDTDLNGLTNIISLSSRRSGAFIYFVEKSSNLFYAYYPTSNDFKSWKLVRIDKTDSGYTPTDVRSVTYSEEPQNIFKYGSKGLAIQHKGVIQTETGYRLYLLTQQGYTVFDINTQDETLSSVEFYDWGMLSSNIGDRTIYKIQTFYDGTFSLDLSDGTTLICGFQSDSHNPFILEIVEPFIIEGDTTVYHRTFTETKLYWYQRPEGTATISSLVAGANAPISSNPYGPYNATKATVDWLAVPRELSRWNTTVLTGVVRMGAQTAKPEFDDTNRRVIDVETAIKDRGSLIVHNGDWTLDDLNKVNGTM